MRKTSSKSKLIFEEYQTLILVFFFPFARLPRSGRKIIVTDKKLITFLALTTGSNHHKKDEPSCVVEVFTDVAHLKTS
jgi:hypothetical protein